MADQELNIILRLTNELSAQLGQVQKQVTEFADNMKYVGTQVQRTGINMTFLGAVITGPMALAFKGASKQSFELGYELERLTGVAGSFQKSIANAMLPVVQHITDILG